MHDIRSHDKAEKQQTRPTDRRRDLVFLGTLGPLAMASFVAFAASSSFLSTAGRTIFLLVPLVAAGVWLAYEQMHDLVWWNLRPLCPTCRRSYNVSERPRPGTACPCCETQLYPLRTPQDFKVIVLITAITVIGLPVYALWSSLVSRLG